MYSWMPCPSMLCTNQIALKPAVWCKKLSHKPLCHLHSMTTGTSRAGTTRLEAYCHSFHSVELNNSNDC